jgi:hypothetical protein
MTSPIALQYLMALLGGNGVYGGYGGGGYGGYMRGYGNYFGDGYNPLYGGIAPPAYSPYGGYRNVEYGYFPPQQPNAESQWDGQWGDFRGMLPRGADFGGIGGGRNRYGMWRGGRANGWQRFNAQQPTTQPVETQAQTQPIAQQTEETPTQLGRGVDYLRGPRYY